MEDRIRFNWIDLVLKVLFLVVFFLILLWLYPSNNLTTFYDKVFNDNVQTMKDGARSYYQLDRLPANEGQSKKMTLAEMENLKIILPFKDKDGKSCDADRSFVEVTKLSSKEYALKVYLSCGDQSDFIIDTIGKEQVCIDCGNNGNKNPNNGSDNGGDTYPGDKDSDNDNIGDKDLDNDDHDKPPLDDNDNNTCTSTEYEFKKITQKKEYEKCPEGYIQGTHYCTKSSLTSVTVAKLKTTASRKVVVDANVNKGDSYKVYVDPIINNQYVCGPEFDNAGTYTRPTECIKKGQDTAPAERKETYTCSNEFANAGTYTVYTKCYASTSTAEHAVKNTDYICGSEYDNAGTYKVPTTCRKTNTQTAPATSKTTYTCSSAYDNAGTYTSPTTCRKTVTDSRLSVGSTKPGYYTDWSCGTCSAQRFTTPQYDTSTKKYADRGIGVENICSGSNCPNYVTVYYYIVYTRGYVSPKTTYTCPSGYSPTGTYSYQINCTKTNVATANSTPKTTSKTTYTCPSGYNPTGTYSYQVNCTKTNVTTAQAPSSTKNVYVCDSSFINKGTYTKPTTCYKDVKTTAIAPSVTTYTCGSTYDNAGTYNSPTTCKKITTSTASAYAKNTYTCSNNFVNAGTYNSPTMCITRSSYSKEPVVNSQYICNNTFDNKGVYNSPTTCIRNKDVKVSATHNSSGSCPSGYNKTGTGSSVLCYKTVKNTDTYYCSDANAKLVGTKCEKTIKGTSKYYCESGSVLKQGKCYKFTNSIIERKEESCKETTEYIWSPTETLEGWTRTGNTRKTNVKCPEVVDCTKEKNQITCTIPEEAK